MASWTAAFASNRPAEPAPEDQARQAFALLQRYFERTGENDVTLTDEGGKPIMSARREECFQTNSVSDMETEEG